MGVQIPHGKGNFEGKVRPIVKYGHSAVICAKMAGPIEMPFGLWARMGPRNRVLDGGPAMLRDVAMATNFVWTIATRQLVMEAGLSGRPSECRYCPYPYT